MVISEEVLLACLRGKGGVRLEDEQMTIEDPLETQTQTCPTFPPWLSGWASLLSASSWHCPIQTRVTFPEGADPHGGEGASGSVL